MGFLAYIVDLEVAAFSNYFASGYQLPRTERVAYGCKFSIFFSYIESLNFKR